MIPAFVVATGDHIGPNPGRSAAHGTEQDLLHPWRDSVSNVGEIPYCTHGAAGHDLVGCRPGRHGIDTGWSVGDTLPNALSLSLQTLHRGLDRWSVEDTRNFQLHLCAQSGLPPSSMPESVDRYLMIRMQFLRQFLPLRSFIPLVNVYPPSLKGLAVGVK